MVRRAGDVTEQEVQGYHDTMKFMEEKGIKISTITMDCKMRASVQVEKLARSVRLSEEGIASITYGERGDIATNRSIVKNKKRKSKRAFYNQATVLIRPDTPGRNYVNIKIFLNGSLQLTGCKDIKDFYSVTHKLVEILKKGRLVRKHGKVKRRPYVDNVNLIGVYDIHIRMINSNFELPYQVDREILHKILERKHGNYSIDNQFGYIEHKYDPIKGHSCVNIKHRCGEDRISVFVFQTGSIIITGAKSFPQIVSAYNFITKLLHRYYEWIVVHPIDPMDMLTEIKRFARHRARIQHRQEHDHQVYQQINVGCA